MPSARIWLSGASGVANARITQTVMAAWKRYWLHVRSLLRPRGAANAHATNGTTARTKRKSQPGRVTHWRISRA